MALIRGCVAQSLICVAIARARPEKITVRQVRGNACGINGYLLEIGRVPWWKVADGDLVSSAGNSSDCGSPHERESSKTPS